MVRLARRDSPPEAKPSMLPTEDMDHLRVLRDKVGRFREEIAVIRALNDQFRRAVRNDVMAQIVRSGGRNAYRQSSMNLYNSQTLAAEWIRQNK